jgi:hypothetical protein
MPLTSCQVSFTSASSRADRACLERAWRSQPADGRLRYTIGTEPLHRFPALMRCELRRTTVLHALGLRSNTAITSASKDQRTLELGQATKHSQRQSTGGVVVSAHGSASDLKPAPALPITSRLLSRSRYADERTTRRLLRARRQRPCGCRAAERA